eukprot:TRINITY_DN935_c0_g2_i4.p2 TRINITY_DN935_c0_g2~~TRINITY_DN935_c0_g2_i4.p2  ORF type:complete len:479 (+),score=152.35 TRINITY_DN935_c0_g2_i4:81-1439(+)
MGVCRWVPVTAANGADVLAQVVEFCHTYRQLSEERGARGEHAPAVQRRVRQMRKSASLRLEVVLSFLEVCTETGARVEKLRDATIELRRLLEEDVTQLGGVTVTFTGDFESGSRPARAGDSPKEEGDGRRRPPPLPSSRRSGTDSGAASTTSGPNAAEPQQPGAKPDAQNDAKPMAAAVRGEAFSQSDGNSPVHVAGVAVTPDASLGDMKGLADAASRSFAAMPRVALPTQLSSSDTIPPSPTLTPDTTPLLRTRRNWGPRAVRGDALSEKDKEKLASVKELEAENRRLVQAVLEINEGRQRMKGLIEQQVFAQALTTRIMGLLHMERLRQPSLTVARGVVFWSLTVLCFARLATTAGADLWNLHDSLRATIGAGLPYLALFILDVLYAAAALALAHEWTCFAVRDICHGSLQWLLVTIEKAVDAAEEHDAQAAAAPVPHTGTAPIAANKLG